jgi:hypothetical protein
MRRILLALRVFFRTLFDAGVARQVDQLLRGAVAAGPVLGDKPAPPPKRGPSPPRPPARNDALSLLATLQREARFVDFVQEPLEGYSDAQIGAAAREVHRDCAIVLGRLFALRPVVPDEEGAEVEVAAGFDTGRYRLLGNVAGQPPFRGRMTHHGWEATACELPTWSGTAAAARVVAPVEVELK